MESLPFRYVHLRKVTPERCRTRLSSIGFSGRRQFIFKYLLKALLVDAGVDDEPEQYISLSKPWTINLLAYCVQLTHQTSRLINDAERKANIAGLPGSRAVTRLILNNWPDYCIRFHLFTRVHRQASKAFILEELPDYSEIEIVHSLANHYF